MRRRNFKETFRNLDGWVKKLHVSLGVYFLGIFLYLFKTAVIPLTASGKWRGIADILAVGFYLSGAITLFGISFFRN
ncbi:DUF6803 family protein, partial [Carboxydocella sporoproducens]